MKYGIYAWFGYALPLRERLRLIAQAGFGATMLWWGNEFEAYEGNRRTHPALARKLGLEVENAHAPYLFANDLWDAGLAGADCEAALAGCIADCADCGIPVLVMHTSDGFDPPHPVSSVGLDRLRRLAHRAEKVGVTLAVENVQRPDYLTASLGVRSDAIGFCYDSGHELAVTQRQRLLTEHGARLRALHLHDNHAARDEHLLPFEGRLDWSVAAAQLAQSGYTGALMLESCAPWHEGMQEEARTSPQEYLARAYEAVCKVGALVRDIAGKTQCGAKDGRVREEQI